MFVVLICKRVSGNCNLGLTVDEPGMKHAAATAHVGVPDADQLALTDAELPGSKYAAAKSDDPLSVSAVHPEGGPDVAPPDWTPIKRSLEVRGFSGLIAGVPDVPKFCDH